MVDSTDRGAAFVPSPGRAGPRITRFGLFSNRPKDLPRVLTALRDEQPRYGYADKNAVMGVLNKCGYKVKGERDDLYRLLMNHGVVLCPDKFGLSTHVFSPDDGELVLDAYNNKRDQPSSTTTRCEATYLTVLYGLGYRLTSPTTERVVHVVAEPEPVAQLPAPPRDLFGLLNQDALRDDIELIRALSDVELDELVGQIQRVEVERDALLELIVKDKARRELEAAKSRERETRRRQIDVEMNAAAAELARVAEEAEEAKLVADKAAATRRNAEQQLQKLERERALL